MRSIAILALLAALAGRASADCPAGTALRFDGVDDWVDFGAGPATTSVLTLEAWVKPLASSAASQFIVGPYGAAAGGCFQGAGFVLQPGSGSEPGRLAFVVGVRGCGNDDVIAWPVPELGVWHHLAGTYDGRVMRFYVDGALVGQLNNVDYTAFSRFVAGCTYDQNAKRPDFFFAGEIDEVRLWRYVRTQTQIDAGRATCLTGAEPDLAAYWNFDEGEGQVANEITAGLHDGRLGDDADPFGDPADPLWVAAATPEEMIEALWLAVRGLGLDRGIERSLEAKLDVALAARTEFPVPHDHVAVNALEAFVAEVSALAGKKFSAADAGALVDVALDAIELIESDV